MSEEVEETQPSGGLGADPVVDTPTEQPAQEETNSWDSMLSSLPEPLRENETIKNTKSFESLADQLINAQSALGTKRIAEPQEDWDSDQWNEFYNNVRPKDDTYIIPENVQIEGLENTPELSEDSENELVQFAGDLGLSQHQFDQLYQKYIELGVEGNNQTQEQINSVVQENRKNIQLEWGDKYDNNLKQANAAYEAMAQEIPEIKELVESDPVVANHPAVLKLFHKIADSARDTLPPAANNPASGFANDNVYGIKSQIAELDADNAQLIMSNPATLSMAERTKRQEILDKRANLYAKLFPES